jgi:predicted RNA methylase
MYASIASHRSMALDLGRNQAYHQALARVVHPESVVLDVGAGLGIHGFLAARLGAKRVYLVEPEDIIAVARQLARANRLEERLVFLQGTIEDVELPEPVDIIVSACAGNLLLAEDLLPSLFYARDRYLKPQGVLIPDRAAMKAVPVSAPELHHQRIGIWSDPHLGIDFTPVRAYAGNTVIFRSEALSGAIYLAEPQTVMDIDFREADGARCDAEVAFAITREGLCHGVAGWFDMRLGDQWLSTAPHAPPLHWSPALLPFDPPLRVQAGATMRCRLTRPPFGDWRWSVEGPESQKHSTVLSVPLSPSTIRKSSPDYRPRLNVRGELTAFILLYGTGSHSVKQIADQVARRFYIPEEEALREVRRLIALFD